MEKIKKWWDGFKRQGPLNILAILAVYLLFAVDPLQIGPMISKGAILLASAALGYYFDRLAFPYARPHDLLEQGKLEAFSSAQIRRAIIMGATILGAALAI